jgi:hypothetical protein
MDILRRRGGGIESNRTDIPRMIRDWRECRHFVMTHPPLWLLRSIRVDRPQDFQKQLLRHRDLGGRRPSGHGARPWRTIAAPIFASISRRLVGDRKAQGIAAQGIMRCARRDIQPKID